MHAMHRVPLWVKLSATTAMLTGLLIAFYAYIRNTAFPARFVGQFGVLYRFLLNKWYFDELYDVALRPPVVLARPLPLEEGRRGHDRPLRPDGAAAAIVAGTRLTARIQTGYLYTYALVMLLGVAAAATWAMAR